MIIALSLRDLAASSSFGLQVGLPDHILLLLLLYIHIMIRTTYLYLRARIRLYVVYTHAYNIL